MYVSQSGRVSLYIYTSPTAENKPKRNLIQEPLIEIRHGILRNTKFVKKEAFRNRAIQRDFAFSNDYMWEGPELICDQFAMIYNRPEASSSKASLCLSFSCGVAFRTRLRNKR